MLYDAVDRLEKDLKETNMRFTEQLQRADAYAKSLEGRILYLEGQLARVDALETTVGKITNNWAPLVSLPGGHKRLATVDDVVN